MNSFITLELYCIIELYVCCLCRESSWVCTWKKFYERIVEDNLWVRNEDIIISKEERKFRLRCLQAVARNQILFKKTNFVNCAIEKFRISVLKKFSRNRRIIIVEAQRTVLNRFRLFISIRKISWKDIFLTVALKHWFLSLSDTEGSGARTIGA